MRAIFNRSTASRFQILAVAGGMLIGGFFLGASVKSYQVTGPVLEFDENHIVVDKNGERWEMERNIDTKLRGSVIKDAKVTVQYRMIATAIDVK